MRRQVAQYIAFREPTPAPGEVQMTAREKARLRRTASSRAPTLGAVSRRLAGPRHSRSSFGSTRVLALVLALVLGMALSSNAVSARADAATSANLQPFYSQRLVWKGCGDKMVCTWLTVRRSYMTSATHGIFKIRVIKDRRPAPARSTREC